jgi:exodeoxyribonuclease VII small subunit
LKKAKIPEMPFEKAIERLERIVSDLESGHPTLDDALDLFQEGVGLAKMCSGKLDEAEKRVEILLQSEAGELRTGPLKAEEPGVAPAGQA